MTKKLAIFGSGRGSNAEKIITYFTDNVNIEVALVVSNITDAGILSIAADHKIPHVYISKKDLQENTSVVIELLKKHEIDFVILAGFLLLIPEALIAAFENKIINIHPSLLPAYGGKGMYGGHVHEAIIQNKETQSGITIHLVNKEYDKGEILYQAICPVEKNDDAMSLAQKIHVLEHRYFPNVIENYILGL